MTESTHRPGLSAPQAASVRAELAAERAGAQARLVALAADFEALVESSRETANDDEHDPEGATIAFERAQVATLAAQARSQLSDLDLAEQRLIEGNYEVCEDCGELIGAERLKARPTARTCIGCAARSAR